MAKRSPPVPNKVFVGLPWKTVKPKYERCVDKLKVSSPLYFHVVGRDDSQSAEDLLLRIKDALDSASYAVFDATGGNPNVSLEFGYAEAKEVERALYLSDHKAATRSSGSPIISDLAGKRQNRYKTEKGLLILLRSLSAQHPYAKRYEQAMKRICRRKRGPQAKSLRALALRVIHYLDGAEFKRRKDLVEHMRGEGYREAEINSMISKLRKARLIDSKQGPHSTVVVA
jgi:hypothetical protein